MKAVILQQPRELVAAEIEEPGAPQEGQVLVRVDRVGVCGTDVACWMGKFPLVTYPRILGHELGVEVLEVGAGVANVKPGDHCSVEPYINRPESYASQRGATNCCDFLEVLGVHRDGGLRSRFLLPARKLHVSKELSFEQLALVETLAIGCHAVDRGEPQPGQPALVIGAGPIGLAVIEFTRLAGAEITVLDLNSERLQFCQDVMGVAHTVQFQSNGQHLDQLQEITGGHLFPVVADATGNAASMSAALELAAPTGRVVYVGITTDEIRYPHKVMHVRELTLLASRNALPKDFKRIIDLIERGEIDTDPWITHRTSLEQVPEDFESFTKPASGVIKAMIELGAED